MTIVLRFFAAQSFVLSTMIMMMSALSIIVFHRRVFLFRQRTTHNTNMKLVVEIKNYNLSRQARAL